MQRIRRFLLSIGISPTVTVLPLIRLMCPLLSNLPEIVRQWIAQTGKSEKIYKNILTVAICYKGRAIPVYWKVFDPKRIETLLIPIAFAYILCVLEGDKQEGAGDVRSPPERQNAYDRTLPKWSPFVIG